MNVSANGTHITITWDPPIQPNGIVNYTVLLWETDLLLGTTDVIASAEGTELFLIVAYMTKPFREYTATVTAQTSAGMGDDAVGMLRTAEGGTYIVSSMATE